MPVAPSQPPHGQLAFASEATKARLSRWVKAGRAQRLAPGTYVVGAVLPLADVVHHHRYELVAHFWPDGVVCAASALAGGFAVGGELYVSVRGGRRAPLELPGMTIRPVAGPGPLPGDTPMPAGLHMSGPARVLVENVEIGPGRPSRHRAGLRAVEDRIDALARSGGVGRIQHVLEQLDGIAGAFEADAVGLVRDRLAAVLGTTTDAVLSSPLLAARLAGTPFDGHRISMIERLVDILTERPPVPRPATAPHERWDWLPFFEAYFSNFIEGTRFEVAEARRIAIDGIPSAGRLEDAHDVAATYRLAVDPADRTAVPRNGDDLVALLSDRHRVLRAARPDKRPGHLKDRPNVAGGYEFVAPDLVVGTLLRGFAVLDRLHDPLARAVAMMALVTECHPFDDGNGRVARLTANAELSYAGEVRIVIPTVYRNNYLAGLNALSNGTGKGAPLVAVLDFAQRWTGAMDWSSYDGADAALHLCNAYLDPVQAETMNRTLRLPTST